MPSRSVGCHLALARTAGGRFLPILLQPLVALAHELKQYLVRGPVRAVWSSLINGCDTRAERGVDEEENPRSIGIHYAQVHGFAKWDNLLVDQSHVEYIHTHWAYPGW